MNRRSALRSVFLAPLAMFREKKEPVVIPPIAVGATDWGAGMNERLSRIEAALNDVPREPRAVGDLT